MFPLNMRDSVHIARKMHKKNPDVSWNSVLMRSYQESISLKKSINFQFQICYTHQISDLRFDVAKKFVLLDTSRFYHDPRLLEPYYFDNMHLADCEYIDLIKNNINYTEAGYVCYIRDFFDQSRSLTIFTQHIIDILTLDILLKRYEIISEEQYYNSAEIKVQIYKRKVKIGGIGEFDFTKKVSRHLMTTIPNTVSHYFNTSCEREMIRKSIVDYKFLMSEPKKIFDLCLHEMQLRFKDQQNPNFAEKTKIKKENQLRNLANIKISNAPIIAKELITHQTFAIELEYSDDDF
jgi:hypothetical protein